MLSASPPEYFIDRSLGRHVVPDALRAAGAIVHVMADVYGERIGQGPKDTEWLQEAGGKGWVVLMKDDQVRYRPAELDALTAAGVRAFCLTNANLGGRAMAERFVTQLPRINQIAVSRSEPYIYGVLRRRCAPALAQIEAGSNVALPAPRTGGCHPASSKPDANGRSGGGAVDRWPIGGAEQARDDVSRVFAARDGDPAQSGGVIAVEVDEDAHRGVRIRRKAFDERRVELLQFSVEVAGLRVVGCPG
ncbi:MAG: hypothetical protein ACLP01_03605 [Solirubrobacteraceae bacterium]